MKNFLRKSVLNFLVTLARVRLKRLRPFVIGITGSVGKTSTKDAVYTMLQSRYKVIRNEKSFNSEFGLPLAILEQPSGFSSAMDWAGILARGTWKAFIGGKDLQMMVLEMGVDKPGDMNDLLRIAKPQIGIVTNIKPVHLAEGQFRDQEDIFMEKRKLVDILPEKGIAILNADDGYILGLRNELKCKKLWYGASDIADLRVLNVQSTLEGIRCSFGYKGQVVDGSFGLLGAFQVYVLLPAIAAGLTQGLSLEECVVALKDFRLPPGRMTSIPGIEGSTLLDSTYNASPSAVKEALNLLKEVATGRKIAVLGNMNELGDRSDFFHKDVGKHARQKADVIVTVGDISKQIGEEAENAGMDPQYIHHFGNGIDAAKFLSQFIKEGDTVLVKGSQNRVRLERVVEALMKDPSQAPEILARQEKHWKDIE